jgi:hypothetical protein
MTAGISVRRDIRLALGVGLFFISAVLAPRVQSEELWMALRRYTALSFDNGQGTWCCLALAVVPYHERGDEIEHNRVQVLWRRAGPRVDPPLLLEAVREGDFLVVEVPPEAADGGTWRLHETPSLITAYSPSGHVYKLRRRR